MGVLAVTAAFALAAFQGLGGAAPQAARPSTTAASPGATSPSPVSTEPVPASWTAVDTRPVAPPDLLLARNVTVEDPSYPELSHPEVDALHYALDLDWDGRTLTGAATVRLRVTRDTDRLQLALADPLRVGAVTLDGRPAQVRRKQDTLTVLAPGLRRDGEHQVVVRYVGTPTTVTAPTTRGDDVGGLGWGYDAQGNVSTYQEPFGAYTWYPVNEHPSDKAYYDITIRAPRGQVGVAGGRLVGREDTGGRVRTRWHLDSPAASYLTTVAVGRYRQHVQTLPGGTPGSVWTLPEDEPLVPQLQAALREAHDFLTAQVGPYPFSTSGLVVTAGQSAMETQSLITLGRLPARAEAEEVTVHELAHQWYGDLVTTRDWQHTWLNEGWAMYWELAFDEDQGTPAAPGELARGCADGVAEAGQAGRPDKDHFAADNIYLCPALMLAELRQQVGDDAFRRLARGWPAEHRYGTATRADLEAYARRVTGLDIRPLTRRWLDQVDPQAPPQVAPSLSGTGWAGRPV